MDFSFIEHILKEDIGSGDHSSLACIPKESIGKAQLIIKEKGVLAGVDLAQQLFHQYDKSIHFEKRIEDGTIVEPGQIAFVINGSSQTILSLERLVLNFMQRMSGIATQTNVYVQLVKDYPVTLLDTRKTTPGLRYYEKWAVRIGGAQNHRMGLYDMIMLKDNHIDYAGGIKNAISRTKNYLKEKNLDLKIEIEVRNRKELDEVLTHGGIDRIMLDNFSPKEIREVLNKIPKSIETEASGGITKETLVEYAKTGIQFISVGALTHSFKSLDLSLKAEF
ncbi:MAG: carboxylating nicotinate-nucleotide diphosphorylase [Flavobacteriia bacterium]|nr:carboxylating nicotinate-nucleotide diphosphorylase [Flavobacteriia bacterium]